jgi:hypothetical protein
VLFRVQFPGSDPFEKKMGEFRDQRRRKGTRQKSDNTHRDDTLKIVADAKSFLFKSYATGDVSEEKYNFAQGMVSAENYDILCGNDTSVKSFNTELSENTLNQSQILSSRHAQIDDTGIVTAKTIAGNEIFAMAADLDELRDTSVIKGRFFSTIEREARRFVINEQLPFTLELEKRSTSVDSQGDSFVLNVKSNRYISKEKIDSLITSLKGSLSERLYDTLSRLEKSEVSGFKDLIDNFDINLQNNTIVKEDDLYELISFKKVKENKLLGFEDVKEICSLLEVNHDRSILRKVSELLNQEIRIRNRIHKTDCVEELYEDEKFIPAKFRLQKPNSHDPKGIIQQRLRAIVLNEYKLCCNIESSNFLNKHITYEQYLETTNHFTALAIELW